MSISVQQIMEKYLKDNGFDGLFNEDGECACSLGDELIPCGELCVECQAGYKVPCSKSDECENYDPHDWHMVEKKPEVKP